MVLQYAGSDNSKHTREIMKSIAIITPKIDTFSNPTLILLFERLIKEEYKILFFAFEQLFIPGEIREKIELHEIPFNFFSFFRRPETIRRPFDIIKMIKQYHKLYRLFKIENKINTMVCIDPMGLVYGGRIRKLINVKIIYASFEIFFEDEFYDEEKKLIKTLEKEYSVKADLVIVQDKVREKLLRGENSFRKDTKFMHIPVSPQDSETDIAGSDICSELNIPKDKTIVVYSGNLQRWSGINEILDLFPDKWNNDFWFVIHSHFILEENNLLKLRLDEMIKDKMNITFHNKPFYHTKDYNSFLSCCHIGLAVYIPNTIDFFAGKNIIEIGLSSGKFSTYMMLGLPTVTTSNSIYKELNEIYNFGETITNIEELPDKLDEVISNYDLKKKGCRVIFKKELDPSTRIDILMKQIDEYST